MSDPILFSTLNLDERLERGVADMGFEQCTPIQAEGIPVLLSGVDMIGRARTGSGKTAAFGLPLLHKAHGSGGPIRALVLTPTRELALQVADALTNYAKHLPCRILTVYGGAPYGPQLKALRSGVAVVVGTPGRVLDHISRGNMDLSSLELFVLDEADEMLRMGFIDDVESILSAAPDERQVALFSATMPSAIRRVADRHLTNPVMVQVETERLSVGHINQRWIKVPQRHKIDALVRILMGTPHGTTLVFARTRRGCAEVADELARRGIAADALHGDLNQSARERVLLRMRAKRLEVVIATDVAARGIDVEHITHVINLDMPDETESYVHRIGRTGRAGRDGTAISFVTPAQIRQIRGLMRTLKVDIEEIQPPSDADIARQQRAGIQRILKASLEHGELEEVRTWLADLLEGSETTAEDVAVAAIRVLAEAQGVPFGAMPDEQPPHWARTRQERPPPHLDTANEVELFFPIGRIKGIRPGDLVGAIANEAGVPGSAIGRITILDRKSFVGLSRELAMRVIADHPQMVIRGIEVPVILAQRREQGDFPQRRDHHADRHGGGGGHRGQGGGQGGGHRGQGDGHGDRRQNNRGGRFGNSRPNKKKERLGRFHRGQ
ncbi:MAG: ATP-dependent RNA helicase DeaD [Kiritimatiellia bacterium]